MSSEYIQALKIGTGLNTNQLVKAIVDARRAPTENALNEKIAKNQVRVSALSNLKSELSAFNANSETYRGINGLTFAENGSSFTASIADNALADAVSHSISIGSLRLLRR